MPRTIPPRIPDELWGRLSTIIDEHDRQEGGRRRIDPRQALDAIIFKLVTGVAWNRLPDRFPDDSSVHRTYRRWIERGVLEQLFHEIIAETARGGRSLAGAVGAGMRGAPPRR